MTRVVLSIAAALVLVALPAVAQYDSTTTQPGTTTTTTTTTEATTAAPATNLDTTTSSAPVQEERTNPQVPTHGPSSGLTASGSVVSWNTDEVVLHTATGMTHFKLLPDTTGATTGLTEGQRVTIDFTRNEQGVLIARQIRPEGTTTTDVTTTGAAAAGANVAEAVEEGVEETVGADVDNDGAIGTRGGTSGSAGASTTTNMPETGSKAPLAGLLGLLALGGAAALRRL